MPWWQDPEVVVIIVVSIPVLAILGAVALFGWALAKGEWR